MALLEQKLFDLLSRENEGLYSLLPMERVPPKYELSSLVRKLFVLDTILIGPLHKIVPTIT